MFFIVNTTKQSLSIADLKLILGPRQGIDLDVGYTREQAEKSKGLKSLISKGMISVKNKTEPVVESRFIQEIHNHSHNEFDVEKMKADIMAGLKEAIASSIPAQQPEPQPNMDMTALAKMIAEMLPQGQVITQSGDTPSKDEEVKIDDDVLADIHSRTVSKMVEGVESGDINCISTTTQNDIDENINELENLLG